MQCCRAVKIVGLNLYISSVGNVNGGDSSWNDYSCVFRLVQDSGNLNFVGLSRGKRILRQDRLCSKRVTGASSFGVVGGSVAVYGTKHYIGMIF